MATLKGTVYQYPDSVAGVFINYRSADGRIAAEVIFRELAANFGPDNIFLDKQTIAPGLAYPTAIRDWIRGRCSVLVAVIGPGWLDAQRDGGNHAAGARRDWVNEEIADALTLGLPVLPVPIHDTPLPDASQLPADIAGLVTRQEIRLQRFDDDSDIRHLIHTIEALDPSLANAGEPESQDDIPLWAKRASRVMRRGAANLYTIVYPPQLAAPLIRLTQTLGGAPDSRVAELLAAMPSRKAAAILENMGRARALLLLREMHPAQRRPVMDHLPEWFRRQMASGGQG